MSRRNHILLSAVLVGLPGLGTTAHAAGLLSNANAIVDGTFNTDSRLSDGNIWDPGASPTGDDGLYWNNDDGSVSAYTVQYNYQTMTAAWNLGASTPLGIFSIDYLTLGWPSVGIEKPQAFNFYVSNSLAGMEAAVAAGTPSLSVAPQHMTPDEAAANDTNHIYFLPWHDDVDLSSLGAFQYIGITSVAANEFQGYAEFGLVQNNAPTTWKATLGSGDWNTGGNWTLGSPTKADSTAVFAGAISQNHTVFIDTPTTVGHISFDNSSASYYLAGPGPLTLSATTSSSSVEVISGSHTFQVPLVLASNTTFQTDAAGSSLTLAGPVTIDAGVALTTTGTVIYQNIVTLEDGASMNVASSTHANTLAMVGAASAQIDGAATLLQVDHLSLDTASKLDVNSSEMIVHNGDLAAITSALKSGYGSGTWNGTAGITSTAAAADSSFLHALGVVKTGTDVEVKYTLYGDADLSGAVDGTDYSLIDANAGSTSADWAQGDFNYDGHVDGSDYSLIDNAFNQQGAASMSALRASPTASIAGATSAVPEPASGGLLIIAAAGLFKRRRK